MISRQILNSLMLTQIADSCSAGEAYIEKGRASFTDAMSPVNAVVDFKRNKDRMTKEPNRIGELPRERTV